MARSGFGKFIGDLAGNASRKSEAIVESARLNTEINRLMAEIEDLQFEIGKAYYEDNKHKSAGPYVEHISRINNLEHEVRVRNEKLLAYKGMQYCEKCSSVVASDDEFCSKCGTPVPQSKWQEQKMECRNCGEPLEQGLQYCSKCGILLK